MNFLLVHDVQLFLHKLQLNFWKCVFETFFSFEVLEILSTKWFSIFFLDKILNFFLIKCCWNFCSQSAVDFFLMICFSKFSLVYLGNIDSWNFSLQNLGYVRFNYFEVVYVHWVIAKRVQSQALLGIQRDALLHNDGGFEAPKTLHCHCDCQNDNVCCYTMLVNVFVKQHFSCGCCQKGLDISGTKCMCKVSYGDFLHCTMIRTSVEWIYWQDPSIYTNTILNIKGAKEVNMPFLWYS
jgi:hypothetical protein